MRDQVLAYAREKLNTDPEYPWQKNPDHAVLRHGDNGKWYAIVMRVHGSKLLWPEGALEDRDRIYDVLNVKLEPLLMDGLRGLPGYLPAYHMNKQSWLTILLDGTVPADDVLGLLNISFDLTAGKQKSSGILSNCHDWLIPANPKYYDVEAAFRKDDVILWKQGADMHVGDTIYMYEAAPWSCLRFRAKAVEVNIPYEKKKNGSPVKIRKAMRIELLETYPKDYMPLLRLREEYGVYSVRGPRSTLAALLAELRRREASEECRRREADADGVQEERGRRRWSAGI